MRATCAAAGTSKTLGHGAGYLYPHDHPYVIVAQDYLPEGMSSPGYYQPTGNGHEATIRASMQTIRQLTQEADSCLDPSRGHRG
ncbi:hypothetical protein [Kocuria palustris]|uniref:AAA family ATPase n=1 Tax=Kocuria palustris TaxID=71999 RepID=UPI003D75EF4B